MLVFRLLLLVLPLDIEGKSRTARPRLMMVALSNSDDEADTGDDVSATSARVRHDDFVEAVE